MTKTRTSDEPFKLSVQQCPSLNENQKKFLLGLSEEQRRIVLNDAKYCLVRSAAGSGKTTVLVAKYLYLTRILGVPTNKIVYLSFNNRNVTDTAKKLKELDIPEDEISTFAFTFHALALRIINEFEGVWPELLELVKISWDDAGTDHDKAEVFLSKYREELAQMIESDPPLFRETIIKSFAYSKGNRPHRYVSYFLDRNGIPGSCRSKQEKDIFDKLAKCGVDFAYEEPDRENHRRPDFTLYNRKGEKVIYEHFTAASPKELETIPENKGKRYMKAEREKLMQFPEVYKDHCIFTFGANRTIDDLWEELKKKLNDNEIAFDESEERKEQFTTDKILETAIEKFKEVRNQIVETGKDVKVVQQELSNKKGYVGYYFKNVFSQIELHYSEFIDGTDGGYTDFADSIVKATKYCNESKDKLTDFAFDYVLVDEFQDISFSRHELLKALKSVNPNMRLVAVGDDWQSIYSFSCSDLSLFYDFRKNWGEKESAEIDMSETFRFGGKVLNASTNFITKDKHLSPHCVVAGNDYETQLVFKPFKKNKSFSERRDLQWTFIKKMMAKELNDNPEAKILILSRYSNVARWLQDDLKRNDLSDSQTQGEISLTIHRAKGLTADIVFIQECQKNAIPLVKAEDKLSEHDKLLAIVRGESKGKKRYNERLQEERRLFYVALTRARKKVYILYDEDLKSGFVDEILQYGDDE